MHLSTRGDESKWETLLIQTSLLYPIAPISSPTDSIRTWRPTSPCAFSSYALNIRCSHPFTASAHSLGTSLLEVQSCSQRSIDQDYASSSRIGQKAFGTLPRLVGEYLAVGQARWARRFKAQEVDAASRAKSKEAPLSRRWARRV